MYSFIHSIAICRWKRWLLYPHKIIHFISLLTDSLRLMKWTEDMAGGGTSNFCWVTHLSQSEVIDEDQLEAMPGLLLVSEPCSFSPPWCLGRFLNGSPEICTSWTRRRTTTMRTGFGSQGKLWRCLGTVSGQSLSPTSVSPLLWKLQSYLSFTTHNPSGQIRSGINSLCAGYTAVLRT